MPINDVPINDVPNHDLPQPALVIMAAGLGSRFGGVKQLARVGANDEAILDFSINDGLANGFGRVILIVRTDIEDDVREHMAEQHPGLDVVYVRQDELGPPRDKPWGTLHALISASKEIHEPFAVINADDYYGPETFKIGVAELAKSVAGRSANVAFQLVNTVPPRGAVTRALVEVADGKLTHIVETKGCEKLESGQLMAGGREVSLETACSMNFWCFDQTVMAGFEAYWHDFYKANSSDPKAEALLPYAVSHLMAQGDLECFVVASAEQWIGITNPEDEAVVRAELSTR